VITRRRFLSLCASLPFLVSPPFFSSRLLAESPEERSILPPLSIGETFAGEELHYDIAFWFLQKVAVAQMTFTRAPERGRYIAELRGQTVGLAGFLTRYRADTYRAVMEEIDGGRRLRSLSFEEQVRIGKKSRRSTHTFDHGKRKWVQRNVRMSGATRTQEQDIPEGQDYNDFLTASYNFRYGVYGAPERGNTYHVPVFPKKHTTAYDLRILSKSEEDRARKTEDVSEGSEYRIELAMDPEVLNSRRGLVEGWLSKELYPVEGIIKDVFLFGDVRGTLLKRIKQP
jgi:hypothetical protein